MSMVEQNVFRLIGPRHSLPRAIFYTILKLDIDPELFASTLEEVAPGFGVPRTLLRDSTEALRECGKTASAREDLRVGIAASVVEEPIVVPPPTPVVTQPPVVSQTQAWVDDMKDLGDDDMTAEYEETVSGHPRKVTREREEKLRAGEKPLSFDFASKVIGGKRYLVVETREVTFTDSDGVRTCYNVNGDRKILDDETYRLSTAGRDVEYTGHKGREYTGRLFAYVINLPVGKSLRMWANRRTVGFERDVSKVRIEAIATAPYFVTSGYKKLV